jgi:hypothetical protein
MTLTRKHFEYIARLLWLAKPQGSAATADASNQWQHTVLTFAENLRGTNSRFDYHAFVEAAGMK